MTLNDIMKLANLGYPDGFLDQYWDFEKADRVPVEETGPHVQGDTLAEFVIIELVETYDPDASEDDQRRVASEAMLKASDELAQVSATLELGELVPEREIGSEEMS